MRVDLVDQPAYSPAYDHALARALAATGRAQVRLVTSPFLYGSVPAPDGYQVQRRFYRLAAASPGARLRRAIKLAEHVPELLAYRRAAAREADIVHFQWLALPALDLRLLPDGPVVLTLHDPLVRGRRPRLPGRVQPHAFDRLAAVIVHSEYARSVVIAAHELDPAKVHVIRHGALDHVLPGAGQRAGTGTDSNMLPPELTDPGGPVVLSFGLLRPYKGLETLLQAWEEVAGAALWIVGRPMTDISALASRAPAGVQIVPRYVSDREQAALFARADVVVLPYERSDRFGFSGVLATALAFGKPIVLSDVGGFSEVAALGAARMVGAGDPVALRAALAELIGDPSARAALAGAAREAAAGPFSWTGAARATLALYETLLQ